MYEDVALEHEEGAPGKLQAAISATRSLSSAAMPQHLSKFRMPLVVTQVASGSTTWISLRRIRGRAGRCRRS